MKLVALVHLNITHKGLIFGWPDMRVSTTNYGDRFVASAIFRQINTANFRSFMFGQDVPDNIDYAVVRGSTYLHHQFQFEKANRTIDSINAPVALVGLGAQNSTQDPRFLDGNSDARSFVARLNEKCSSISVRGDFTAKVVERLGGKNIRVTGCPTLFYHLRTPEIAVPEMLRGQRRSLAISTHIALGKTMFCRDPDLTLALQGRTITHAIKNSAVTTIYEQGTRLEYDVADRSLAFGERLRAAQGAVSKLKADLYLSPLDLMVRTVSVRTVEEWIARMRDHDAAIGFRFHGNMVAMVAGRPSFYFTYDSRLSEFCDLYHLPSRAIEDGWQDPIQAILDHDWAETNRRFAKAFGELKAFYEENGVDHTL
ncbi:polysaccharide pyruvyl transferase family protein [Prosthecodimorpha staleyi]|uniref:Polysaccharide pyruvyl transferase family protein n=1 Tax=Prosthecodimorpha staleyi TaxID=2840188 RepID=A0A947DC26_9HYPH|nr:polysaccharide pyruvyl transferase family protein [Prosthecodimorpha staleyi]MBT9293157.1 polysaccharide pyruvyl transferase family protein [Prosthecodimorpha staleyi]